MLLRAHPEKLGLSLSVCCKVNTISRLLMKHVGKTSLAVCSQWPFSSQEVLSAGGLENLNGSGWFSALKLQNCQLIFQRLITATCNYQPAVYTPSCGGATKESARWLHTTPTLYITHTNTQKDIQAQTHLHDHVYVCALPFDTFDFLSKYFHTQYTWSWQANAMQKPHMSVYATTESAFISIIHKSYKWPY